MRTTITPPTLCPSCGYRSDRAISTTPESPPLRPGDISVCVNCSCLNIFKDDLTLRKATEAEIVSMMEDDETRHILQQAQTFFRKRGLLQPKVVQH